MDPLRLNRKDGLFILICAIIFVAGLMISVNYFQEAFPEATINFRYNRPQTEEIATNFLQNSLGMTLPADFRHASRFGYAGDAKIYLEKELGVEGARKYLGHPIRLWYWAHRWFKPSTKEEFRVYVSPEGEIIQVRHDVEETATGANLAEDSARAIATHFLFSTMRLDSNDLLFLESQRTGRPNRTDWSFIYRAKGIEPAPGSQYRYAVDVTGDRIGYYREYLHVPEAWWQSFTRLRSYNEMAGSFSGIGMALTVVGMIAILALRIRKKAIRWKTALGFGLVATALMMLNQINDFPLMMFGYDTTASWPGFLTREFLLMVLQSVGAGVAIFLLTAAAETMYREQYGDKMAMPLMFTFRALRTKAAFKNILLGITLTSFFLAYQIIFYLVAGKFGAWSPSDVPYDNLLNTAMPWLAVLMVGFFPAVSEEFLSRAFSIPFLQKIFRNRATWFAVLLPAFIWGFGHSSYPNEPFYIRGIEVGVAGIIIGIVMLKFGILAPLVWHYTVDALYTALLLFRSENPYFIITAAVATGLLVIPLLIAFIAYLRKGRFEPDEGILNRNVAGTEEEPAVEAPLPPAPITETVYQPFPRSCRIFPVVLLALGIGATLIPVSKIGEFVEYKIPAERAIQIFSDSLRATGWANPDTLKINAFTGGDDPPRPDDPSYYLLKHSGSIDALNKIQQEKMLVGRWRVYAWQPENRLRFAGSVHGKTGKIHSLYSMLPEEMPGDSLSEDSARAMVEAALTAMGEDLTKLEPKEHSQQKRPNRLDHWFVYEAKDGDPRNVGEAKYRRGGSVDGNRLSVASSAWFHIPEKWERERKATTTLRAVKQGLTYLAIGGLVAAAAMILVGRTRKGLVPWKKAFYLAIVPAILMVGASLNQFFYLSQKEYFNSIEIPWTVFQTTHLIALLIGLVFMYLAATVVLAFLGGLYPERLRTLQKHERRAAAVDALLALLAGIGAFLLVRAIGSWINVWKPEWITLGILGIPDWLGSPAPFPTLELLDQIVRNFLRYLFLFVFVSYLWSKVMLKPWMKIGLIIGLFIMFLPQNAVEPMEWFMATVKNTLTFAFAALLLKWLRGQAIPMMVLLFGSTAFSIAWPDFTGEPMIISIQCIIALILVASAILWWLGLFSSKHRA